jgi:hypothetical protein
MERSGTVRLPPGYRVEWAEGSLRLFDPRGHTIARYRARPGALRAVEEEAWRHTWRQVERDVRRELREFRRGARGVPELHRLRQYVRLMEVLAEDARETQPAQPAPQPLAAPFRWTPRFARSALAVGVAAAGVLIGFLLVPPNSTAPRVSEDLLAPARVRVPVPASQPDLAGPTVARPAAPAPAPAAALRVPQQPAAGYAVTFGRFATLKAAQFCARRIRAKGYLATVVTTGRSFRVISRIYPTRLHADRMALIFREIDLPATAVLPVGVL